MAVWMAKNRCHLTYRNTCLKFFEKFRYSEIWDTTNFNLYLIVTKIQALMQYNWFWNRIHLFTRSHYESEQIPYKHTIYLRTGLSVHIEENHYYSQGHIARLKQWHKPHYTRYVLYISYIAFSKFQNQFQALDYNIFINILYILYSTCLYKLHWTFGWFRYCIDASNCV